MTADAAGSTSVAAVARELQRRASEPGRSVWVAASAGSGKTKVLTDRVLRLLLSGARPERILCLTFTKAAAAEMATRIASRLSVWSVADDAGLRTDLAALSGDDVEPEVVERARRLFATVLDAPGGLQVQTIHGFCQSVLRRFPLEADLPPQFDVLDERTATERMRMARDLMILRARNGNGTSLSTALAEVSARVSEDGLSELVGDLLAERSRLQAALEGGGNDVALEDRVRHHLGLGETDTDEGLLAAACSDTAFDGPALRAAAQALDAGTKTDQERADVLAAWLADPESRPRGLAVYRSAFLTREGTVRARLATKRVAEANPGVPVTLAREAERLLALEERRRALDVAVRTSALVRVAHAVLEAYEAGKRRHGLVDYDDLILAARDLLDRPGVAPWVLFKLDGGLDHILIDEAQDTNPEQWRIVAKLTEDFFAGAGAAEARGDRERTVFAVGDVKQSIFSFQRADPQGFLAMRDHFAARVQAAERAWEGIGLDMSFRSTSAVLNAVDAVFNQEAATGAAGLGVLDVEADGTVRALRHQAHRSGQAGRVEVWPPEMPEDEDERPGWAPPVKQRVRNEPRRRLAVRIAAQIKAWMDAGEWLHSKNRPVRPGDIMVLVRRRGVFVDELVRALKEKEIEVAGVDRMMLTDQLAVMDLVAFGQFLLLPEDDLNLAAVLKGPLIGLTEEQLFILCHDRPEPRLWRALTERAQQDATFAPAVATLSHWLARADFTPPYELFAELLASGGRRRILERLGPEASDPVDEFLAQALEYERAHVASLQGFLHWLAAADFEVKRDLETGASNQVRILTVHGSKGLQAPIVFLPDTMPAPNRTPKLLWSRQENGTEIPLWSPGRSSDDAVTARARAAAADRRDREYRRLLYVAMTRAEDRLYVAGWGTRGGGSGVTWHQMIDAGLRPVARLEDDRLVMTCEQSDTPDGRLEPSDRRGPTASLPSWAAVPPLAEEVPPRPLSPSRLEDDGPVRSPFEGGDSRRFRRGRLIHYLLQWLPLVASEDRARAAERYLSRPVHGLDAEEIQRYRIEAMQLLEDPRFTALFSERAMAEAPIVGTVGEGAEALVISGRIDRLLVTENEVLVVDFKTNRPPPARVEDVPVVYIRQMAAYRSLLRGVYPDRPVRCALLWTDGPGFMALPDRLLSDSAVLRQPGPPVLDGPVDAS